MKSLLTIFFLLFFCRAFTQNDSFLQSLIDSAKTGGIKDSQKRIEKVSPSKDSIALVKKDSQTRVSNFRDSFSVNKRDSLANHLLTDSGLAKDSTTTALIAVSKPLSWEEDTAFARLLSLVSLKSKLNYALKEGDQHIPQQKDYLFYLLVAIVLLLAIIKQLFPKYFQSIFRLTFQATFRQKQTREQMMQQALPSLLMNILFVLVAGLFISLLATIYHWLHISFWLLTVYTITVLALVYIFKYLFLKFMGWVFNAGEQASTYGFIVFLVNKVIGIALLPLLLLLAFSVGPLQQVALTIAAAVVILLLIFRYIVSLTIIRRALSIHPLHFFIYLCAVELMPMLILYKVLFSFVGKSY